MRGQDDVNIHRDTEKLVCQVMQQNEFWKIQQQTNGSETNNIDSFPVDIEQRCISEMNNKIALPANPLVKLYNDSQGSLHVELSELDFYSVPESIRGRCKIENVKYVAIFAYMEVISKFEQGLRGNHLCIDRQNIAKHTGGVPGLYSIIMNTSLWREIVFTLQFLNFLKVERDGTMMINIDF